MKKSYPLLVTTAVALLLQGCASSTPSSTHVASNLIYRQDVVKTVKETYPAKNPQTVAVYGKNAKIMSPYRVIGKASVSKYNLLGSQRKESDMHNMMKHLAASIGGDALMDVNHSDQQVEGKVIQYQRILI